MNVALAQWILGKIANFAGVLQGEYLPSFSNEQA